MKRDMGFIIMISVFFMIGFIILGQGIYAFYQGRQSFSWPSVEGQLLECNLLSGQGEDSNVWTVKVKYSYEVEGEKFLGERLAFGYGGSGSQDVHQEIYEKLKSATKVLVRYMPGNPDSAVLAAGAGRSNSTGIVFAVIWLVFTTGFTVIWLYSSVRETRLLEQIQIIQ